MPSSHLKLLITVALFFFSSSVSILASDPPTETGFLERLLHPDTKRKIPYAQKVFATGSGYTNRTYDTHEYGNARQFASGSFVTRSFAQARQSWLGKMVFQEKKLPENLQGLNRDAIKQYDSKSLSEKNYAELDKKSSFATKEAFQTRNISLKGKSQGAIDNDPKLQDAIKKGLSIDDVQKLLNKAP